MAVSGKLENALRRQCISLGYQAGLRRDLAKELIRIFMESKNREIEGATTGPDHIRVVRGPAGKLSEALPVASSPSHQGLPSARAVEAVNTTGSANTATGFGAFQRNTVGDLNTAMGVGALSQNTTGSSNTATGHSALHGNTSGFSNTASGLNALAASTTGSRNTAVGQRAGFNATTGSNNIFLGSGAEGVAGEANTIRIGGTAVGSGGGQQNRAFLNGIRGVTTGMADAVPVMIDSSGQLGTVSSSSRFKKEVAAMGRASSSLLALRPVTFRHRQQPVAGGQPLQFGLIAEEVAEVFPELVIYDQDGKPIKIENLPSPGFPAPPLLDHTQYRSVILKHEAEDKQFEYSGTNAFTARIEAVAPDD